MAQECGSSNIAACFFQAEQTSVRLGYLVWRAAVIDLAFLGEIQGAELEDGPWVAKRHPRWGNDWALIDIPLAGPFKNGDRGKGSLNKVK